MKIDNADIEWLEDGVPFSRQFRDVYFSREDPVGEALAVYVGAHDLKARWSAMADGRRVFVVAELGFGFGLNFLLTWQRWRQWCEQNAGRGGLRLHYVAWESHPVRVADLQRFYRRWPELQEAAQTLASQYVEHSRGCHRLLLDECVTLDLVLGEAQEDLEDRAAAGSLRADCWYADGFSPACDAGLWEARLFALVAHCSAPGATLSSYSVAGAVRRGLGESGFAVERLPGFGSKRQRLFARLDSDAQEAGSVMARQAESWLRAGLRRPVPASVMVIGAGLAGCCTAWSLARRGIRVTVLEAAEQPASGASGNTRLALRARLFGGEPELAAFFVQAFCFALRHLKLIDLGSHGWQRCGLIQLAEALNQGQAADLTALRKRYADALVGLRAARELGDLAGVALNQDGLYFPDGGWVSGRSLCAALLGLEDSVSSLQSGIELRTNRDVQQLLFEADAWRAIGADGEELARGDAAVIANSAGLLRFSQCDGLPVQALRGQTTEIVATPASEALRVVVCGQRTVFPASVSPTEKVARHTLAASYERASVDLDGNAKDDHDNIDGARQCFQDPNLLSEQVTGAWVGLRSATPDRLPLLGPAPDLPQMLHLFAALSRDASLGFDQPGSYYPGLYLNAAHGSNGLAVAPLAGEALASLICHEPLPLRQSVLDRFNPVRFLIRRLKRQQS